MKTAARDAPARENTTMQAIVQDRYGEAGDVLRLEETGRPAIGDGEVLLRVRAAGVERQARFLQREAVDVTVEERVGVGGQRDREARTPEAPEDSVVVAQRRRTR